MTRRLVPESGKPTVCRLPRSRLPAVCVIRCVRRPSTAGPARAQRRGTRAGGRFAEISRNDSPRYAVEWISDTNGNEYDSKNRTRPFLPPVNARRANLFFVEIPQRRVLYALLEKF